MALDITIIVTYFAILLGFGVLVANLSKRVNIPDVIFLILLGILIGPTVFQHPAVTQFISATIVDVDAMAPVPDFLRILALIMIVFTGTFNLSFKVFKKFSSVSIKLSIVGPIFNTLFLGFAAYVLLGLEPVYALLLGAVLSGTGDFVVFTFRKFMPEDSKPMTILWVEAVLNSPLSVLLPLLLLELIGTQGGSQFQPLSYAGTFWLQIIAGGGAGLFIGFAAGRLVKNVMKEYTALLLFSIALITFALTETVGGSGLLAVAICGLIVGNTVFPEREEVRRFDDHISEMLRISVFTLFGAGVALFVTLEQVWLAFLFFLVVFLSRILYLIPILGKERKEMSRKDMLLLAFAAPKGIESAATAPIVAASLIAAGQGGPAGIIINVVILVMIFTIIASTIVVRVIGSKYSKAAGTELGEVGEEKGVIGKKGVKFVRNPGDAVEVVDIEEEKAAAAPEERKKDPGKGARKPRTIKGQ
ncbi:MAG: cation:proton antiporter [Candidatus Aenigmarchaeota archaeon]|nr:cation:proton antiporter [Candidatus Aenigmarchaeota archaeon]